MSPQRTEKIRRTLRDLKDREYRSAFVSGHVRRGLALQLRALRQKYGPTQSQFAAKIGKSKSIVAKLENPDSADITVGLLLHVAASLDVALKVEFIGFDEFLYSLDRVGPSDLSVPNYSESAREANSGSSAEVLDEVPI